MGSLESWLLLRSLRTHHLRIPRQSETATALAQWLKSIVTTPTGQSHDGIPGGVLTQVWHSSLQGIDSRGFDPKVQMEGGWNATFAIQVGAHLRIKGSHSNGVHYTFFLLHRLHSSRTRNLQLHFLTS